MNYSPNIFIGSLVHRTAQALNKDRGFLDGLAAYDYAPTCMAGGRFHLWHFPGTHNEISGVMISLGKHLEGGRLKFPAILDFHPIRERRELSNTVYYNLAIVAPVRPEWTTQERDAKAFAPLLRPVYAEFMRQVRHSPLFTTGYDLTHDYYEIFTTGSNAGAVKDLYGDYVDAIELHNLALIANPRLCWQDYEKVKEDSDAVTDDVKAILNGL